jgi:transposase InsO family protein
MDEDPSNEAFVLSLLEGYDADEVEAMDVEPAPNEADWRDKYITWMDRGELPSDRSEARRIARMAKSFTLVDASCTSAPPPASCSDAYLSPKGSSSSGTYTRACATTMPHPAPSWATRSARAYTGPLRSLTPARSCAPTKGASSTLASPISPRTSCRPSPSRGLLSCGGLDIAGPLRKALGGYTHLLVAIDKFSKWVEVRPITNLRVEQAVTFFTDIVCHFGVPNSIITDNGSQFTGRKFLEFCDKFHIRVDWAAVAHPQTNGQVECANGVILQGLKPRIFDQLNKSGRKWLQELPAVVWSLRTTPSRATGFTPFFLVHGAEAVLPTDLEYGSPRVRGYDEDANQ